MPIIKVRRGGFTLGELLAVIFIIASLAAIVFPVFPQAVSAAKRTTCLSNLMQIGHAVTLYEVDNDDHYPYAINAVELRIPSLPLGRKGEDQPQDFALITDVLASYVKESRVWVCPMDTGRNFGSRLSAKPNFYPFNGGSSYFLMDMLRGQTTSSWTDPSKQGYAFDASELWHSPDQQSRDEAQLRHNVLFYDGRVANVSLDSGMGPTYLP